MILALVFALTMGITISVKAHTSAKWIKWSTWEDCWAYTAETDGLNATQHYSIAEHWDYHNCAVYVASKAWSAPSYCYSCWGETAWDIDGSYAVAGRYVPRGDGYWAIGEYQANVWDVWTSYFGWSSMHPY